eukprot:scaffold3998_cov162-Amphora_coffeaeformis.AAC.1
MEEPGLMPEMNQVDKDCAKLGALNTSLCFLCCINAHCEVVRDFLTAYPEALLFEGTATLPEEAAIRIVEAHLAKYQNHNAPSQKNRLQVRRLIREGFIFFKDRQRNKPRHKDGMFCNSLTLLMEWEHCIGFWRQTERRLRQQLLEEAVSFSHGDCRKEQPLGCLSCVFVPHDREIPLEVSVIHSEKYEDALREIRNGRRKQFQILKQTFSNVPRCHDESK